TILAFAWTATKRARAWGVACSLLSGDSCVMRHPPRREGTCVRLGHDTKTAAARLPASWRAGVPPAVASVEDTGWQPVLRSRNAGCQPAPGPQAASLCYEGGIRTLRRA